MRKTYTPLLLLSFSLAALLLGACGGDDPVEPTPKHPDRPLTLAERGFEEIRAILHLHSAFSHDACDDHGLDASGEPDWDCVRRMKAAVCAERIGLVLMTDHPSYMDEQPFEDLLYAELGEGDELLRDDQGDAWGVRFACPEGQGVDGGTVLIPGFEGTHTMPMGLRRHLSDKAHYGVPLRDDHDAAEIDAMIADVQAAGGFVGVAHAEDGDVSGDLIAAHDIAAMELYNFHANFQEVLGDDLMAAVFLLEPFLESDAEVSAVDVPAADLSALVMLGTYPEAALTKFREVSSVRPITGFSGSDIHENVVVPAICADTDACDHFEADYPNLLQLLKTGGNILLSDGDRIDSYGRVIRWVQNRVWIAPGETIPAGVEGGLLAGRNIVVFEVLGDAPEVTLVATTEDAEGAWTYHDMGETLSLDDNATLWARSPDIPTPGSHARWTDGSAAVMSATIWRTDAEGTVAVKTWDEPGAWVSTPLDTRGSYQLEVTLIPRHLSAELGSLSYLAEEPYRWVETNAIRVE